MKATMTHTKHFISSNCGLALIARAFLCLAASVPLAVQANPDNFKLGPLVQVSTDSSPFAGCDPGSFPGPMPDFQSDSEEKETRLAINPANPNNLVAIWIGGKEKGNVAGVSFDGGKRWQNVVIPGLTKCSGGTREAAVDPWVSFGPDGRLYQISLAFDRTQRNGAVLVS